METRANYALIGLFTLAVIAAGFGFVFWFSGSDSGQRRQPEAARANGGAGEGEHGVDSHGAQERALSRHVRAADHQQARRQHEPHVVRRRV